MNRIITVLLFLCFIKTFCQQKALKKIAKNTLEIVYKNSDKLKKGLKTIEVPNNVTKWAKKSDLILKPGKRSVDILDKTGNKLGKITIVGNKKTVTTFSLIGRKKVNPLLNKIPFSNTTYKIDNTIFKTDKLGRVTNAKSSSISKNPSGKKDRNTLTNSYKNHDIESYGGVKGKHQRGHIIAHSLGGNSGRINIVAQLRNVNQGLYKNNEVFVGKNFKNVKNYEIKISYSETTPVPKSFIQKFEFRGSVDKLKSHKATNLNFKYRTFTDENGNIFYKCITYHKNET